MCKDAFKKNVIASSPIPVAEGTAIHDWVLIALFYFSLKNSHKPQTLSLDGWDFSGEKRKGVRKDRQVES